MPQTKRDQTDLSLPLESVLPVPSQKKAIDPAAPGMDEFGRLLGYITLLAALAGAAVYLIKFGIPMHRNRSKEERKLQVLEMRSRSDVTLSRRVALCISVELFP